MSGYYELHLVKANYAPIRHAWAYKATPTGALALVDLRAEQHAEHAEIDAKVLAHIPPAPFTTNASSLAEKVFGSKSGSRKGKIDDALDRLLKDGKVVVNEKGNKGNLWSTS